MFENSGASWKSGVFVLSLWLLPHGEEDVIFTSLPDPDPITEPENGNGTYKVGPLPIVSGVMGPL